MERSVSYAFGGRQGTIGGGIAAGSSSSANSANAAEYYLPIGPAAVHQHSAAAAVGGPSSISAVAADASTHLLSHSATCVATHRMNGSGTVVVIAGDQQISCYFDASHAQATNYSNASDCFSNNGLHMDGTTSSSGAAVGLFGGEGFTRAAPSASASPFSQKPLNAVVSSYIETVPLTGAGGAITCVTLEPVTTERDTLLGVVGLTNGKVVPFIIIGPANKCYGGIAAGNTGLAASASAGAIATGFLKPRIAVLPFLDLTSATSHSVSSDDAIVSVAIGTDTTAKGLNRIEFIAAATSNCVALFNCMGLFSVNNGLGGAEPIIAALFGIVKKKGGAVPAAEEDGDDAEAAEEDNNTAAIAAENNLLILAQLGSFFTYKGFNVYSSASVLKVRTLSSAMMMQGATTSTTTPAALRRVFASDFASAANGGALPVALTHGSSSSAVTATMKGSALEIVASAVLAVVLEDGSLRFIGRCVDARSWGFGAPSSAAAGGAMVPTSAAGSVAMPLASSPSMAPIRGSKMLGRNRSSGGMGIVSSSADINTSAIIARSNAIYHMPLSSRDPEYQYISLNDVVKLNNNGTNASAAAPLGSGGAEGLVMSPSSASLHLNNSFASKQVTGPHHSGHGTTVLAHAAAATANGLTDTLLNDAEIFFNPNTNLVDTVVAGVDLLRAGNFAAADLRVSPSNNGAYPLAAQPTSLSGHSVSSGNFVSGSSINAAAHPNPVAQSFGFLNVTRSVVHGSVFHPASSTSAAYSHQQQSALVDVDVALPTPQSFIANRVTHYQRVGHARFDRRGLSIVRVITAPMHTTSATAAATPQACLIAAGTELFFSNATNGAATSSTATPAVEGGVDVGGAFSPVGAKGSAGATAHSSTSAAASHNATALQYVCGFGGPIQDVQVLSVVPAAASGATAATAAAAAAGALIAIPAAVIGAVAPQQYTVTALVALGKRVHLVKFTF